MTDGRFFSSPEFCEYLRLLVSLHEVIAADRDEGPEGEVLRDQMDVCGEDLTDAEVASLLDISSRFYALTEDA